MHVDWYFDSLHALWQMEGHGPYVWSVYFIVVVVLAALVIQPVLRRKQLLQTLRDQSARQKFSAVKRSAQSVVKEND